MVYQIVERGRFNMAQKRSIFKEDLHSEDYLNLSDKAKVLLWEVKAFTDDYGFFNHMALGKTATGATDNEIQELIDAGYLFKFSNKLYLYRWFQKDNSVQYGKTQQSVALDELTYVYLDNNYYYHISAVPVRSVGGWAGKEKYIDNKGNEHSYKNKDIVTPRSYLFESNIEEGYKIIPLGDNNWEDKDKVASDYLKGQLKITGETGDNKDNTKKEEALKSASSTQSISDDPKQDSDTGYIYYNNNDSGNAQPVPDSESDDLPF